MSELLSWVRELDKRLDEIGAKMSQSDKEWRRQVDIINQKIDSMPRLVKDLSDNFISSVRDDFRLDKNQEKIFYDICERYYTDKYEILKNHLECLIKALRIDISQYNITLENRLLATGLFKE